MEKFFNSDYIREQYDKLSYKKKVAILSSALGYMQLHNGRSETTCIGLAMGFKNDIGLFDTWTKD